MKGLTAPTRLRLFLLLLGFALTFSFATEIHAATLYVAKSGDGSDGLTWETALHSISEAVVQSTTGDSVWIQSGTYEETLSIDHPLNLIGGFQGTKGEIPNNGIILFSVVDGGRAGSVIATTSEVTLRRLKITNGLAVVGAGVFVEDGTLTMNDCQVINNQAVGGIPPNQNRGGGVAAIRSYFQGENCEVRGNQAGSSQPTAGGFGGGLYFRESSATLEKMILSGNRAHFFPPLPGSGGASAPGFGGGLNATLSKLICNNVVCYSNTADEGGEVSVNSFPNFPLFESCTFVNLEAGGLVYSGFSPRFMNCVIFGTDNFIERIGAQQDETLISFSNIQGGYPGEGNIDADPLFVDPDNGDFRLQPGSPCIDSASTTGPPTDLDGNPRPFDVPGVGRDGPGAFDMGAYEFIPEPTPAPTLANERSDIDGNDRVDAKDLLILLGDWMKATGASR